jgi:type I restriction enzyme, S subunit
VSRIDDLIAEHCPKGVEFSTVDEVGVLYSGLTGKSKADFAGGNARFVTYLNVFNNLVTDVSPDELVVVGEGEHQNRVRYGDVLFTASSESAEEVAMASAVVAEPPEPLYLNSFCFGFRPHNVEGLDPQFAKHLFRSAAVRRQIVRASNGVTRINVSKERFRAVEIPVPPLAIQRGISAILDRMNWLEAELEAQLEAELECRSRQYAYYRRVMLDQVHADVVPLSSLGRWQGGVTPSKANPAYWESGTIPWLASMDVSDTSTDEIRGRVTALAISETSLRLVPAPSVAVVMRSNILRRMLPMGLIEVDTTVNQDMRVLVPREGVDAGYVFQTLRADSERIRSACVRTDGSMAAVNSQSFFGWEIPLPSIAEQRRIAEKLRNFDAVVNDLTIGLPAEINARRQQYEYYRDKLMAFEEKSA